MNRRLAAGAVLTLLAGGEASAQDRPELIPKRDVDMTYRVTRAGQTITERVRWLAAGQLERVDPPGSVYMIVDHKNRHLELVNRAAGTVLQMDAPQRGALEPDSGANYTKMGESKVAGLSCTEWMTPVSGAVANQICVTADGVMLRIQESGHTLAQATEVQYRRLDPKTFEVPPQFRSMPPAAAPPPPGIGALVPE